MPLDLQSPPLTPRLPQTNELILPLDGESPPRKLDQPSRLQSASLSPVQHDTTSGAYARPRGTP